MVFISCKFDNLSQLKCCAYSEVYDWWRWDLMWKQIFVWTDNTFSIGFHGNHCLKIWSLFLCNRTDGSYDYWQSPGTLRIPRVNLSKIWFIDNLADRYWLLQIGYLWLLFMKIVCVKNIGQISSVLVDVQNWLMYEL